MAKMRVDEFRDLGHGLPMTTLPTPDSIREAAKKKGLTIAALCRRADMDTATFYRWEYGRGSPTLGTIKRLLDAIEQENTRGGER
jgi:predicted transcriptional regulator